MCVTGKVHTLSSIYLKPKTAAEKSVSKQHYQKEKKILSTVLKKKKGGVRRGWRLRGNVPIEKFCFKDSGPHEKQQPRVIC